jgi:hypothetical protein
LSLKGPCTTRQTELVEVDSFLLQAVELTDCQTGVGIGTAGTQTLLVCRLRVVGLVPDGSTSHYGTHSVGRTGVVRVRVMAVSEDSGNHQVKHEAGNAGMNGYATISKRNERFPGLRRYFQVPGISLARPDVTDSGQLVGQPRDEDTQLRSASSGWGDCEDQAFILLTDNGPNSIHGTFC